MSLQIAKDGQTDYVIGIAEAASEPESFAAEELRRYLYQITGATLPIEVEPRKEKAILIGAAASPPGKEKLQGRSEDAFVIKTDGAKLCLVGASPRSTLYSVYTFLEDCLGCGWIRPGDEHIPDINEVEVEDLDVLEQPSFKERMLVHFPYNRKRTLKQIDWMTKQKMNRSFIATNVHLDMWDERRTRERVVPELRKRGLALQGVGHSFYAWLPPEKYFDEHPEYFSLIDGKRNGTRQICFTNPGVWKEIAKNICEFVDKNPEVDTVTLWRNDVTGWCQCEECQALLSSGETYMTHAFVPKPGEDKMVPQERPSLTKAEITLLNNVAEIVEKTHPQVQIETLAYGTYRPSSEVSPRKNVRVGYAMFDRLWLRESAAEPVKSGRLNRWTREYLEGWVKQTDNMYIYDYYDLLNELALLIDVMADDLKYYRELGIDEVNSETVMWNELHMYAFAKLAWNCNLSPEEILRSYCKRAYDQVAEIMLEHWNILRRAKLEFKEHREECSKIIEKAKLELRKLPMSFESPGFHSDDRALGRLRELQGKWTEEEPPW